MSIIMRAEMAKVMTTPKSNDDASNKKHIEKNNAGATSDTGNINKAKTTTNENEGDQNGRYGTKQTAANA